MSIIKKENVRSKIVEKSNTSTRMDRSQQRKRDWGFKKKKQVTHDLALCLQPKDSREEASCTKAIFPFLSPSFFTI